MSQRRIKGGLLGVVLTLAAACVMSLAAVMACGGRPDFSSGHPGTIDVRLSAGTPVAGATVTVYAVDDANGQVDTTLGSAGVIGIGGPTDSAGKASITLTVPGYSGPIQVTASGSNLSYLDPSTAAVASSPIQIPASFVFSSFYANYASASGLTLPVNLLTTLADHEAMAYARGRHAQHPGTKTLSTALGDRDRLFVTHISSSASLWSPTALRTTIPAALTAGPQTLNDSALAAFFDVSLSGLGHATAQAAGYPADSTTINAITLTQLLIQDVDADGVFDGRGAGGVQLATDGKTPLALNSQFLRIPLAKALDQWIQSKSGNASGIAQGDLVSSGVYVAISQDQSDLFGDPPDGLFNPTDRVPPEVSFATEPARHMKTLSNQSSVTLAITATDPSGVTSVSCASSSSAAVSAATQQADRSWACEVPVPAAGTTQITVWAVDSATPPNSGQGQAPPYMLTRTITVDNTPPSVTAVAVASYYDELGVTLGMNGNVALVPATYQYASGTKITITNGSHIRKVGSRLGWATQPSTGDLEGANPDNIPFLQFSVPYNSQTDAPITTANYSVAIAGHSTVTGALWPSAKIDPSVLYFDLPLASNLFPDLGALTGPTAIAVTLNLADAAGNAGSRSGDSYWFDVLGPPLGVVEDAGYANSNDTKSTYPYSLGNGQYETLYDGGTAAFYPENVVRLVHYFVTNPVSQPVVLVAPAPGSWAAGENWTGHEADTGNVYRESCTATCSPEIACRASACGNSEVAFFPSGGGVTCGDPGVPSISGQIAAASLLTVAYGMDGSPAAMTGGNYIVPAASGDKPGMISLYVVRPRGLSRGVPISGGAPWRQDLGHALKYKAWSKYGQCLGGPRMANVDVATFEDYWYYQELDAASDSLSGSFQPQTYSFNGNPFGEVQTSPQTITISRNIVH